MSDSSGDLLADRRFAWAMALKRDGDMAGAADLFDQVIVLVPDWAPAWAALGEVRDRLGQSDGALAAWRRVASLDPEGRLGATLQTARLGHEAPETMPAAYITALFDDYASTFDRHLVQGLGYRAPALLLELLDRVAPRRAFVRALDLGCGTGLMGRALAGRAAAIDGADLSPKMVEAARRTGYYDALGATSIDAFLAGALAETYDLVLAADVFVYVGDLGAVFSGVFQALAPGGLFAFTLQRLIDDAHGMNGLTLGADMRFSHTGDYAVAGLKGAGFEGPVIEETSLRTENGLAVPGLLVLARRT